MMQSVSRTRGANTGNQQALSEEADLIRRCRLGEREAEEEFYRRYRRGVAATLFKILNDRTDMDDLVQEVFVIAFRGLARFRGEARLSTWLYRICVNVALGRIRTKVRRPPPYLVADLEPAHDPTSGPPETPERSLQRRQERERVYRVLEQLAPKKRAVFYLHEIEGYDLKEIAYLVDANAVTVRTRLFYARQEFYKLLARAEADEAGESAADNTAEAPDAGSPSSDGSKGGRRPS